MKKILLLALFLRITVMSITLHSDLLGLVVGGWLLADKGITDIWSYYLSLPKGHELVKSFTTSFFPYPPLTLFTFGLWVKIINPLSDGQFLSTLFEHLSWVLTNRGLIWHIFLFKLIYLPFDFGIGWLLWKSFKKDSERKQALLLWLFNPVVFYSLAMGNFDLIPTFFVVLSLYFAQKKQLLSSSLALGVGAAYKMFPLLFLPLIFVLSKKPQLKLKVLFLGLAPLVLSILPFWNSAAFRSVVLFSPLTQKFLSAKIMISENSGISIVLMGLAALYFLFAHYGGRTQDLWRYGLAVLLVVFGFTDYHLQWFVWLMPFLIMALILRRFSFWKMAALLVGCWAVLVTFASPDLHLGLLVPLKTLGIFPQVNPGVTQSLSPQTLINPTTFLLDIKVLVRSIFAGTSLVLIGFALKPEDHSKKRYFKRV